MGPFRVPSPELDVFYMSCHVILITIVFGKSAMEVCQQACTALLLEGILGFILSGVESPA